MTEPNEDNTAPKKPKTAGHPTPSAVRRPARRFLRQTAMERVLLALLPLQGAGIYFFGWRTVVLTAVCLAAGYLTEWLMARRRGDPVTEAVFVTGALLGLSLPPLLPFWMAATGAVVAVLFGKEVFGGFGRNVFNPAIVGRGFLYICFPMAMTGSFSPAFRDGFCGLNRWAPPAVWNGLDAISAATPLWVRRDYGFSVPLADLFTGRIGGIFTGEDGVRRLVDAGCVGEVSAALILLAGAYLLITRTANWRLSLGMLGGATTGVLVFRHGLGFDAVPPLPWTLCSGALLFGAVFMVTDPVSAPKDRIAQHLYAWMIGLLVVFLRWKSVFAGGLAFAILLGNTVGPSLDLAVRAWRARKTHAPSPEAAT